MTLGKWEFQLNTVLVANGYESFGLYKNYTRRAADQKAKEEFRKFRNTNIIHKDKVKSISSNHSMKKDNKRTKGD